MTQPRRSRLLSFLTIVGAITTTLLALLIVIGAARCACGGESVPQRTILELDLERAYVDGAGGDPLQKLLGDGGLSLADLVATLERAAHDDRVVGLVARVGGSGSGMAATQEIRDAIAAFRASGKFAVAFSETFGEGEGGNQGYYLATAFDEIWLQPSGDVGLDGLLAQTRFLRGTLDLLEVDVRMDHRHEYKNALNTYTEKSYTAPHREALGAVLQSMHAQLVRGIADGRKLDASAVSALVERGPFLGPEAAQEKLVDRLGYRDEVHAAVKARAGAGAELLYADKYLERAGRPHDRGARIAVVHGVGAVTRGETSFDPLFGGATMGSKTVSGALREAIDDPAVKAIVFRVDSPGGSYVASDTIWRETVRAKQLGKPIIVSMGNVAGSGGYFVAMDAAKIVAQPGTITGSIGVLGGKLLTRKLFERIGVTYDSIKTAGNADMYSDLDDYSVHGWQRFQAGLDRVYADFTAKVAAGRGLTQARVHEIARGRIWSGEEALKIGLVDELGGWPTAIRLAREAAGLTADEPIELRTYPKPRNLVSQLLGDGPDNSESSAAVHARVQLVDDLKPIAQELRALGLGAGSNGVLATPDLTVGP